MRYALSLLLIYSFVLANAQSYLEFTVSQLPLLVVDAGNDTTVTKGSHVTIGGDVPASGGSGVYTYSWSPIIGLNKSDIGNPVATVDSTITYTLYVNDGKGCTQSAEVTLRASIITGLHSNASASGIYIFPNPTKGTLYITTDDVMIESSVRIEVFDLQGKRLYHNSVPGNRRLDEAIDLGPRARGIYILKITGPKLNSTLKFIVQ